MHEVLSECTTALLFLLHNAEVRSQALLVSFGDLFRSDVLGSKVGGSQGGTVGLLEKAYFRDLGGHEQGWVCFCPSRPPHLRKHLQFWLEKMVLYFNWLFSTTTFSWSQWLMTPCPCFSNSLGERQDITRSYTWIAGNIKMREDVCLRTKETESEIWWLLIECVMHFLIFL